MLISFDGDIIAAGNAAAETRLAVEYSQEILTPK